METVFEKDKIVSTKRIIKTEQIYGTNLVKYMDIKITSMDNEAEKETSSFGITSLENIQSIKDFETVSRNVSTPKAYQGKSAPVAITEENYKKLMDGEIHITDAVKDIEKDDELENGKLFLFNWGSHKLLDLNGEFVSIPITLSYMEGLDNENYKLQKALWKLKTDTRILHRDKLCISGIPYYNCEEGRNKQIECKCLLSDEEYRDIVENSKDSWCIKFHLLNDLLGLQEFRKNEE